jgi:hypothetical protein
MKNILVKFECQIGEYQHIDYMLFNKKKSEMGILQRILEYL